MFFFWLSLRLFSGFDHSNSIIDAVHDLADLLLSISFQLCEPSDPSHAKIVRGRRVLDSQKAIELLLGDGFVWITVVP